MRSKLEPLRIELLGSFRVSVGSRVVEEDAWRLKKVASLVKLLALAPNHRLHREQLMQALWPGLSPKAASNNLRGALHLARRILEPDSTTASGCLRLRDAQVVLCPEETNLWVDVEAFEAAAATARRTREPAAYRVAIDLYAGELLPQDRYEGWTEERREALRQLYLALLLELAGLYEERGELERAIEVLRRAVAEEPAHEDAHTELMRLYAESGRRHEAISEYQRLRNALFEKFGVEPGEASRDLYEEILTGRPQTGRSRPESHAQVAPSDEPLRHNLPAERTSFVGRADQIVEVERLLSMTRLLTLTGAGGCGKTRFALAVARNLAETYPDGVWLAELAALSEGALVPQALAQALEVREQPGRPLAATLKDALSSKKLLLVLDNCEHLIEAAASLVETLLDSCPGLRVLATSREALNVSGELTWLVPSLSVPDPVKPPTVETLAMCESVRLFVERARYRNIAFELTPQNAQAVAKICWRLDGMPLAIELAAARVGALSVEQILKRLEGSLKWLAGSRTAPPRQRTLEGALDWSFDLLSEPEKRLFLRLSVFAGGWTLEAAEVVGAGEDIEEEEVLELLLRLVEKSLVAAKTSGEDEPRYRMLEPVHQYAREKLEASAEADALRHRHATFFLHLAENAELALFGPEGDQAAWLKWLQRLQMEHDNLRAALSWSLLEGGDAHLGVRLAGALGEFWYTRGHLSEGRRWLERALAVSTISSSSASLPSSAARAKALEKAGWIAIFQGDENTIAMLEESLRLYKELDDKQGTALALADLGWALLLNIQADKRRRLGELREEAQALRQEDVLDRWTLAHLLSFLALAALDEDDHDQAVALFEESLALYRGLGDQTGIALCLSSVGMVALEEGDHERAATLFEEALRILRELGDKVNIAQCLLGAAAIASIGGRAARAGRLWGAAEVLREAAASPLTSLTRSRYDYEGRLAAARSQLEEAAWEAAWAEGRAMTLEQAVEYALSGEEEPALTAVPEEASTTARGPAALSRREKEIATLVARELTNRQIAEELVLSEHTVATHVRKILKKLGLRSRVQISAWVAEQQSLSEDPD